MLDYDDQDSHGEEYLEDDYGATSPSHRNNQNPGHDHESPAHYQQQQQQQQQRHSFVQPDRSASRNDDDPWRDEDDETYGQPPQQRQQPLKMLRPDSELDSFRDNQSPTRHSPPHQGGPWTQQQYVDWMNRNLPESVGPVDDITQSLRSGVVLVRLVEQLSGEQVDKRIPNATYTLQMLENLLTAFKFMDRVGISTDGYTVKDIFNGNEEKIVQMFENIRAQFPGDAPQNYIDSDAHQANGNSSHMGNGSMQQRSQGQYANGSEYEALYDEAARSTIG
ncbi:hypothetical protein BGX26_009451 [Mortierella sp. AD094]|nr:hypothetical protein BGX26_009451 [Mortierella sp. AD094]